MILVVTAEVSITIATAGITLAPSNGHDARPVAKSKPGGGMSWSSSMTCTARSVVTWGDITVAAAATGSKQRQHGLKGSG